MATAAIVAAAGSAYAANQQKKAAEKANKAMNGPWSEVNRTEPWDEAMPYLSAALPHNLEIYEQATRDLQNIKNKRASGGYSSGGMGSYSGPDPNSVVGQDQKDIAARMKELAMNGDPLTQQAKDYLSLTLGGATGGEMGLFANNPVYRDLYGRLGGASFDRGADLLTGFLADNPSKSKNPAGGGGTVGGGESTVARRAGKTRAIETAEETAARKAAINARLAERASSPAALEARAGGRRGAALGRTGGGVVKRPVPVVGGPGGVPPDTVGDSDSFFAQQVRALWDPSAMDPANNPALAPYIEQLTRRMNEQKQAQLDQVSDQYAGLGGFGSSGKALEASRTRSGADDALASALAGVYMEDYGNAWNRRMQGLDMTNTRDLAAMGDLTTRYGIDQSTAAQRDAAAAAAGAQLQAMEMQRELGMRAQDLEAIGMMLGHDRAGLGMLAGLGDAFGEDMKWAVGGAASFRDQDMGMLERSLSPFQSFDQQRAAAAAERSRWDAQAAAMRAADAERERAWDYQDLGAQGNLFGDYLKGLGALVDLGPQKQVSTGTGGRGGGGYVNPGPGAWAAGLSSLGGNMMQLYGAGAFNKQQPTGQGPVYSV